MRAEDSRAALSRYELMLMDLTATNGHGKCAALNNETRDARFPLSSSLPQAGERGRVSLREFHVKLTEHAEFDQDGFTLKRSPSAEMDGIEMGRYELPRRSGEAHLYRIHHPLAVWVTEQAKAKQLSGARLVFDYDGYGTQVSTLKAYRGQTGWLKRCSPLNGS